LAVALLSSVPVALDAQGVVVGAKGGLTFANISTDDSDLSSSDTRNGIVAGLFLQIGLGEILALQPEVLYAQKGFSDEEDGVDLTAEFDYIEIPLLLKARFGGESSVRPALYAGPVISFESSCSISGEEGGVSAEVDCDLADLEFEDRKTTDFGVAFGGELQFDVSESVVALVDARYALGLSDLASDIADAESVKTKVFSVMAGLGIKVN
jgi:hypothetical protein